MAERRVPLIVSMDKSLKKHPVNWLALIAQIRNELSVMPVKERAWLEARVAAIGEIQHALNRLFQKAGGIQACAVCDGECCDCGRHHLTLINIIAFLVDGDVPPAPDFENPCPFLGDRGCLLPAARRPYNCITFFCDTLDERLDEQGRREVEALDQQLRNEYERVEKRYPVATLRGIWMGLERVFGDQLLRRGDKEVVQ